MLLEPGAPARKVTGGAVGEVTDGALTGGLRGLRESGRGSGNQSYSI